jgi:hypothetical protein
VDATSFSAVREYICGSSLLPDFVFRIAGRFRRTPARETDIPGAAAEVARLMQDHRPDLIMLHSVGGADAAAIIEEAVKANVPVLTQLHFANDRYAHPSVRTQVARCSGVSGVSDLRIPPYLRSGFVNLKTGLASSAFVRVHDGDRNGDADTPVLLLPGRIVPTKGRRT